MKRKKKKRKNNGGGGISVKIICKKSLMMSTKDSEVGRVGGSLNFSWGATLNKNNNEWGCVNCVIFTNSKKKRWGGLSSLYLPESRYISKANLMFFLLNFVFGQIFLKKQWCAHFKFLTHVTSLKYQFLWTRRIILLNPTPFVLLLCKLNNSCHT